MNSTSLIQLTGEMRCAWDLADFERMELTGTFRLGAPPVRRTGGIRARLAAGLLRLAVALDRAATEAAAAPLTRLPS